MNKLGNPQNKLKFVHIAGTNGKGSCAEMLSHSLTNAGYVTGEYTSPYIYRYNDRIKINGEEISDDDLSEILQKVIPNVDSEDFSQFEITTAVAFLYYLEKKCDIVVLETGLGGLLDCTNIIDSPVCSVITSISLDHTDILGKTVKEIAYHKAGIIKENSPVILECDNPCDAVSVVSEKAGKSNSKLIIPDKSKIKITQSNIYRNEFIYKGQELKTKMPGLHQINNAVTSFEALHVLKENGFEISDKNIYDGIYSAVLPSRCEIISENPTVILDGAHNPDGMKRLAQLIKSIEISPKIFIVGMLKTKDIKNTLANISPIIDTAICVDGFSPYAQAAEELMKYFKSAEKSSVKKSFEKAKALAGTNGLIIIGGSLYLASEFKSIMK